MSVTAAQGFEAGGSGCGIKPDGRPDLSIVVIDPLRSGHAFKYHPGEATMRMADVVVINKMDSATPGQ